jgi:TonB family protein
MHLRRPFVTLALLLAGALPACHAGDNGRTLVRRPDPIYPALARQMRLEGVILLEIRIEPNGHVSDIKLQKGHPLLVQAAEEAVRQWKFAAGPETTRQIVRVEFVCNFPSH